MLHNGISQNGTAPNSASANGSAHPEGRKANCVFLVLLDGDLVQTPEHLGIGYLVAVLRRAGHHCTLLDISPKQDIDIVQKVQALAPDFIGISLTTVNLPRATAFGQQLRAALPTVHICAGGPIATFMGDDLLELPAWSFLSSIVRGEAEDIIVSIVEAVLAGEPLTNFIGVAVPGQVQLLKPVASVADINTLPWPARDQLEAQTTRMPYVRVSTSRGCTARCTFCNAPHAGNNIGHRKIWRGRDPEDVVDELEYLVNKYKVDTFDFVDSTFEDPGGKVGKDRVRRIAELILERNLKIYYNTCAQAVNWHEEDNDLLALMYRSGLEKVLIGIESGSDRMLEIFKKRSRSHDNARAIRLFGDHHVYVAFGFIMYMPYTQWSDIEANAAFLTANMGHNLRRFSVRLELYPGAEVVPQLQADGLLHDDYWQTLNPFAYTYQDPSIGRLGELINSLYGENYVTRGFIDKEPSVFAFETFDITLHTYMTRLLRAHHDDPAALEVLTNHEALVKAEKQSLTQFNAELFDLICRSAKNDTDLPQGLAEQVEVRYEQAMNNIKSIQLRLGMGLRRRGIRPFVPTSSAAVVVHAANAVTPEKVEHA